MRFHHTFSILAITLLIAPATYADPPAKGLGDPGQLKALSIDTGRTHDGGFLLSGRDSGQQLLVNGQFTSGQVHDQTRNVSYESFPAGVADIDTTGYVAAVREGTATITARSASGRSASVKVTVTNIIRDVPMNFANEVVPVFTRYDCNSGGCHGKSGGQNGFSLSLLGFEPQEDYEYLVKENRAGRRIMITAPEHSLLLRKASGQMAHGGGKRIEADSPAYRILRRWIAQAAPYGKADDPVVTRIQVLPAERVMNANSTQQLAVIAHYSDGSTRDVTRLAQFDANDKEMAAVSATGLVTTASLPGNVAIMARYQAAVDVFRATIPLGAALAELPAPKNFIDELVFKQLKTLGLPPSAVCDDATFIRRVTIDIAGRLPTLEETRQFLADKSADRREKLVDSLLASKDYAFQFANKWSTVLRNKRSPNEDSKATVAFHGWIVERLDKNVPYDQFVRDILTATGKEIENPPVSWYREVQGAEAQLEDVAQLFLGQRIQCARCHHHPLEKWSQQDYFGFSAFFTRVAYKKQPPPPKKQKKAKGPVQRPPTEIYLDNAEARAKHPRTGEVLLPAGLGSQPMQISSHVDPRARLAEWMADRSNPFFARALVNRYWKHFFGRGLVDPEDDMRVTNPATNPELLAALEQHFIKNGYDLKNLVRTICTAQVYQLSSLSNEHNASDKQNFSHYYPRRLNAEVLLDAIDQVTLVKTKFAGITGVRAVQLPDSAFESYFLSVFGRPTGASACECERSSDTNLAQLLHLLNSADIQQKVNGTRAGDLTKDQRPHAEKVRELYLIAVSRPPTSEEFALLLTHLERHSANERQAYGDIIWALINSQEFLFNH